MVKKFLQLTELANCIDAYEVFKHCMYMPTKEKYATKVDAWKDNESVMVYACYCDEKIRGVIVLLLQNESKAEILGISVDEKFRNHGIGSYMINQIVVRHSLRQLSAETDDDAIQFYIKSGFKITRNVKVYDGKEITRYRCILS